MQLAVQGQHAAATEIVILPGDCRFTANAHSRLITRNLKTCVALAVHVPKLSLAALLRCQFPDSSCSPSDSNPWLFVDTAIPLLFEYLGAMGAPKPTLSVYAIGGAAGCDEENVSLGKHNILAARRLLWREGVLLKGEEIGGASPRSVWLEAASGRLIVRTKFRVQQPIVNVGPGSDRENQVAELCHSAS